MNSLDLNNLIIKKLSGEITTEEAEILQVALDQSQENKQLFEQISKIWQMTEQKQFASSVDKDSLWLDMETRLDLLEVKGNVVPLKKNTTSRTPSQNRNTYLRWIAVAAVVILMSVTVYKSYMQNQWQIYTAEKGARKEIILPDNSIVTLNSDSEIKWSKTFTEDSERIVILQGQAFFAVEKTGRPFIVRTVNSEIKVLGTSFDVYSRYGKTELIVKEGVVAFSSLELKSDNPVIVKANQRSVVKTNQKPTQPEQVNSEYLLGWLNNRFVFYKTPLREITEEIERRHDIKIQLNMHGADLNSVSGAFEEQSIDSTLASLCLTLNLNYTFDGETYIISR